MSAPRLIGIYSPARQHGKTTVAEVLVHDFGYKPFKFAGPIYAMWDALLLAAEVDPMLARRSIMDLKETPLAEAGGLSFRVFAEGVGTTWGRQTVSNLLWVNIAKNALQARLTKGQCLVVDDMRFPEEMRALADLGGESVMVDRVNGARPSLPSEGHLQDFEFDVRFHNDGTKEQLQNLVRRWIVDRQSPRSLPPTNEAA